MWSSEVNNMILNGILETLYMTLLSTIRWIFIWTADGGVVSSI